MAKVPAIFYPSEQGEIEPYYNKAADAFAGALGVKYGTSAATILLLNDHKANGPLKRIKAYADTQTAQQSHDESDAEDAAAKTNMLMEMQRVQRLPIWEETDAEAFGMRKVKTPVDLNTVQGKISAVTALPDKNVIDWVKGRMEGIVIESIVDAPGGPGPLPAPPGQESTAWKKIGTDSKSPFEDTRVNVTEFPETRYYRIRYTKDDMPVGQYSDIKKVVSEIHIVP